MSARSFLRRLARHLFLIDLYTSGPMIKMPRYHRTLLKMISAAVSQPMREAGESEARTAKLPANGMKLKPISVSPLTILGDIFRSPVICPAWHRGGDGRPESAIPRLTHLSPR
ncbi:MAG: hypothetical protein DCC49_13630 [Acidobacteria bacterium]|nr:MAG: hypothetical protein DCC49_13630 [Acidobacteriota bacterium]